MERYDVIKYCLDLPDIPINKYDYYLEGTVDIIFERPMKSNIHNVTVTDNEMIAVGTVDEILFRWDLKTGKCTLAVDLIYAACSATYVSSDIVIRGCHDNAIRVWDAHTGKCQKILTGHTGGIYHILTYKTKIISSSSDNTIKIWNNEECEITIQCDRQTNNLDVLSDGKIVSFVQDNKLNIWNGIQCIYTLEDIFRFKILPNDSIACAMRDNSVYIINPDLSIKFILVGHRSRIYRLNTSLQGTTLITGDDEGYVIIWDLNSGNKDILPKMESFIYAIDVLPTNQILVTLGNNKMIIVDENRQLKVHYPVLVVLPDKGLICSSNTGTLKMK